MTVRKRSGAWYYRKWIRLPSGDRVRIFGTPRKYNLPNNRAGAEEAERRAIREAEDGKPLTPKPPCPTLAEFEPVYLQHSRAKNKHRTVQAKEQILRDHIRPAFGKDRIDSVTFARIEDFKHSLLAGTETRGACSAKTANNILTVLRRLLMLAYKRGHIASVPEIEWLHWDKPGFDFLTFEEARALVAAADGEWRAMISVALATGLRQGELLALQWDDVDLKRHRIRVSRSVSRGVVTSPKGRRSRDVELGDDVTAVLARHRHLRGQLVFCDENGRMLKASSCKHPLYRACRKAKIRNVGWHVLRHTFASHLAMLGASMKSIQELLGHASMAMTMRYAHLAPETKRETAKLLDSAQKVPNSDKSGGL
jgi:integrase